MPISEIYNEDNMIGMSRYPDKFFDLAIVDPPYGILNNKRLNHGNGKLKNRILNKSTITWDYSTPPDEYFVELERISVNQIIWGGNYFDLPPTRCIICWDKVQPWENFSQWEMAWTSFNKPAAFFKHSIRGGNNLEVKIHPTQKPLALYKWLLNKYALPGNKILDTHMGSQSSRIAAYQMGFDYWGWEIDKEYFQAGNKRFKEQTAQLKLL